MYITIIRLVGASLLFSNMFFIFLWLFFFSPLCVDFIDLLLNISCACNYMLLLTRVALWDVYGLIRSVHIWYGPVLWEKRIFELNDKHFAAFWRLSLFIPFCRFIPQFAVRLHLNPDRRYPCKRCSNAPAWTRRAVHRCLCGCCCCCCPPAAHRWASPVSV